MSEAGQEREQGTADAPLFPKSHPLFSLCYLLLKKLSKHKREITPPSISNQSHYATSPSDLGFWPVGAIPISAPRTAQAPFVRQTASYPRGAALLRELPFAQRNGFVCARREKLLDCEASGSEALLMIVLQQGFE
jgi:hypothetical protein